MVQFAGVGGKNDDPYQLKQSVGPCELSLADEIKKARRYATSSIDVTQIIAKKRGFYNFGLRLLPAQKSALDPQEFDQWRRENWSEIYSLVCQVWNEFLVVGSVIAFWRTGAAPRTPMRVILLPPERCDYQDPMGIETLKFRHELTESQIRTLPEEWQQRYRGTTEVTISDQFGEAFRVLKTERVGNGLGRPPMRALFTTLDEHESLEVGENLLGLASRLVFRQHKLGHAITTGPRAGLPTHFYKKATGEAVKKFFEGRTGLVETVTNFDQSALVNWIDPKLLDAKKWDSTLVRMLRWGGPVALMLHARGPNPFLMPALQVEANDERARMELFLSYIINEVFSPPTRATLRWSDRCFKDVRTAAELIRFGVQQGATSYERLNEEAGNDHTEEHARKIAELKQKQDWLPLYDAAHGPGDESPPSPKSRKKANGRPPGTPDPTE